MLWRWGSPTSAADHRFAAVPARLMTPTGRHSRVGALRNVKPLGTFPEGFFVDLIHDLRELEQAGTVESNMASNPK